MMTKTWTAEDVLRVSGGFQAPCVLAAGADLGVFGALAGQPMAAEALAGKLGADARATRVILDALAAMGLLMKTASVYALAPGVADTLTDTGRDSVVAMVRHRANCLRRWVQLAEVALSGKPGERRPSIRGAAADTESFIGAMEDVSAPVAARLVGALAPHTFRHVLDVGGGPATWSIALLRAAPEATATLFDLPDVVPLAERRLREAGLLDRVTLVPGNLYTDPLPAGADLAWVSAIIHMNSREQNRELFAKVHAALDDGGQIVVRDVVMDESRVRPVAGAFFAVNMLVATPGGGTYTFAEIRDDLESAGFIAPALVRQGEFMDFLVRATKEGSAIEEPA